MKVLHLSSSYPYTDLYKNLLYQLDNKGIEQIMYVSLKGSSIENKRKLENPKNTEYIFSNAFNKLDRYVYYTKINKIYRDIEKKIDMNSIDIQHAHFLFSDGGVTYRLKEKYGTEYIVAVRNADVNFFFKYGLHIRKYGIKILREAKKVIFISPAYKKQVINHIIPSHLKEEIELKSIVVPNGVDDFWLNNIYKTKDQVENKQSVKLVYVGEINKNKNVLNSLNAIKILKDKGYVITFDIVGKGSMEEDIIKKIHSLGLVDNVKMHGFISNRNELLKLYRNADIFLMPSFKETFGLVYIEAMTQGLPIVYTQGQGVDGYFKVKDVGNAVIPDEPTNIANGIIEILKNYNDYYSNAITSVQDFNWSSVADEYINYYKE